MLIFIPNLLLCFLVKQVLFLPLSYESYKLQENLIHAYLRQPRAFYHSYKECHSRQSGLSQDVLTFIIPVH
jgi:hypothetical protein